MRNDQKDISKIKGSAPVGADLLAFQAVASKMKKLKKFKKTIDRD